MMANKQKYSLDSLFEITAGGDVIKSHFSNMKNDKFKYNVYSNQLTDKGLFGYYDEYDYQGNYLTITARGTIGHCEARINEAFKPVGRLLVLKPLQEINLIYVKNMINNINFISESTGIPQLTAPQAGKYTIDIFSDIKKQNEIADCFINMEHFIYSLEELIEKKEKIKKATMELLLNGIIRLPGFHQEWKNMKMKDIGIITSNGVDKKIKQDENKVLLLNYVDIMHQDFIYKGISNHIVTTSDSKREKCNVLEGDLFFTPSSETREDIGVCAVAMEDIDNLVYSYHIIRLRPQIKIDKIFSNYLFKNKSFLEQASRFCEGSGKRYVCSAKKFSTFNLYLPSDIEEQKAIGKILFDIDEEISLLKNKWNKYQKVKKAMMKDLLNGKVR